MRNTPTPETNDGEWADEAVLSRDTVFEILRNSRRREVLRYLRRLGERSTLSDIADEVARREHDLGERDPTSEERKRVYISLYQCHLPMMDDAGVVHYDDRKRVELLDSAAPLFVHLDVTAYDDGRPPADSADRGDARGRGRPDEARTAPYDPRTALYVGAHAGSWLRYT